MSSGMDANKVYQPPSLDWRELGAKIIRAAYVATACELCIRENPNAKQSRDIDIPEHAA